MEISFISGGFLLKSVGHLTTESFDVLEGFIHSVLKVLFLCMGQFGVLICYFLFYLEQLLTHLRICCLFFPSF